MMKYLLKLIFIFFLASGCNAEKVNHEDCKGVYKDFQIGVDSEAELKSRFELNDFFVSTVYRNYCVKTSKNRFFIFKFYETSITEGSPVNEEINILRSVEVRNNLVNDQQKVCKYLELKEENFGDLSLGDSFDHLLKEMASSGYKYLEKNDQNKDVVYFSKERNVEKERVPRKYKEFAEDGLIQNITYSVGVANGLVTAIEKEVSYRTHQ